MVKEKIKIQVKNRIAHKRPGAVFTARDFSDIADNATIRQNLKRLTEDGTIRRIGRGVYDKPAFSKLLKEYEAADIYQAARTLAKAYSWTIAPSGNTALNMLGLSTQVSSRWSFVSDGPYKKYTIAENTIEFKHRTNRELTGMSEKTILIIQSLKALGKEQVTENIIAKIQQQLSVSEKNKLLVESRNVSRWIVKVIKEIGGNKA
jgi:predicted transcriptional regulator of viral defense system